MMNQLQPLPVLSQSQQVMNIMNNMNNMNNRNSHVMTNQSQSQVRLNNRRWMASNPRNNNNRKARSHHNNWKESVTTLKELQQQQNRVKPKRYISKKKFNYNNCKSAPYAPRNTTSFLIRAKKAGGITSLVSPLPVTPAVLPTPVFSPSREILMDTAKEEWGVDGYGSMKGLIRLRSPSASSESDVEEHLEVERKLDHDLGRFEMICPNYGVSNNNNNGNSNSNSNGYLLENRVDDQDTHIARLEEKNLTLKNRLFLMEREFDDLRTRLRCLEMRNQGLFVEEVVENEGNSEVLEEDKNKKSVDSVLV